LTSSAQLSAASDSFQVGSESSTVIHRLRLRSSGGGWLLDPATDHRGHRLVVV